MKHPLALFLPALLCFLCGRPGGTVRASEPPTSASHAALSIWQDIPPAAAVAINKDGAPAGKGSQKIQWDEWALPIGNGRLGAVFYGHVADELIQFNEDSLWTGGDAPVWVQKEGKKPVDFNYGSYQPFGDVRFVLPHSEFTEYRRDLDLTRAVGTVTYKSGGVTYRREYFASYPDQVIVVRVSADKAGSITGSLQLVDRHFARMTAAGNTITAQGKLDDKLYISKSFYEIALGTPDQIANAAHFLAGNNMKYEAQMRVIAEGGALSAGAEGELKVTGANSVVILLAAGTDYVADISRHWRGDDPHEKVTRQMEAAAKRTY
jgi:alpha-L-fucosidase 2